VIEKQKPDEDQMDAIIADVEGEIKKEPEVVEANTSGGNDSDLSEGSGLFTDEELETAFNGNERGDSLLFTKHS